MSDAGEIVGRLRLDAGNWFEELDRAEAKARELGGVSPKVRVSAEGTAKTVAEITALRADVARLSADTASIKVTTTGTAKAVGDLAAMQAVVDRIAADTVAIKVRVDGNAEAIAKLAAVRGAERQVEDGAQKIGKAQKDGQKDAVDWQKVLIGGLIAVSAAAPPVAAAAVGIAGAFGAMGAAGVLGLAGIVRGMKDGTGVGESYRGVVGDLTGDLHTLEDTAAKNLLPGVQQAVDQLHGQMPGLADAVGHFAGMLGNIIPTGLDAVVNLLERGMPLFNAAGQYVISLVDGLDRFSTSNGYSDFIAYSVANLPNVESFLGTLVGTVGDFLAAWAPLGAVTLPLLTGLLGILDGIIQHTGPLVPLAVTVVGAFMAWQGIAPVIAGIAGAIDVVTASLAGMDIAEAIATGGLSLLLGAAAAGGTIALLSSSGVKAPGGTGTAAAPTSGHSAPAATGGDTSYNGFGAATTANTGASAAAGAAAAAFGKESAAVHTANAALNAQVGAANAAATANTKAATAALGLENADDSAKDSIAGLTAAVKQNGTSLDQNTAKGRANREQIAGGVSSIQAAGTAYTKAGGSASGARIKMDQMAVSLVNTAVKAGISRTAAEALVSKLMGFPKGVTTTIDLKRAKAEAALVQQKKALQDFVNGDYTAALKADPSDMKAKVADAQQRANAMAHAQYLAFLKANPANANSNSADAARKAHAFATGAYMASLRADAAPALAAARSTVAQINAMRASISVSVNAVGGNGAQVAKNALLGGAHGGTVGSAGFGKIPRMATGGTLTGPGTAATDTAGMFYGAVGEELVSNLWGGASTFRPLLKSISAGKVRTRADALNALGGARDQGPQTVNNHTVAPEIHIHNPVAVDPVTQTAEAAQLALAYAGLG